MFGAGPFGSSAMTADAQQSCSRAIPPMSRPSKATRIVCAPSATTTRALLALVGGSADLMQGRPGAHAAAGGRRAQRPRWSTGRRRSDLSRLQPRRSLKKLAGASDRAGHRPRGHHPQQLREGGAARRPHPARPLGLRGRGRDLSVRPERPSGCSTRPAIQIPTATVRASASAALPRTEHRSASRSRARWHTSSGSASASTGGDAREGQTLTGDLKAGNLSFTLPERRDHRA